MSSYAPTTSSPGDYGGDPSNISDWVLFAIFTLLALVSPYLSILILTILRGVAIEYDVFNITPIFASRFQHVITHALISLFLFLGWVVFLPFAPSVPALALIIHQLIRFYAWIVLWIFALKFVKYAIDMADYIMKETSLVDTEYRKGIIEAAWIAAVILLFIFTIFMLFTIPVNFNWKTLQDFWVLFAGVNIFTVALAVALTPFMRDVIAGLTLFGDRVFFIGNIIEIPEVCSKARVVELRLRSSVLRLMDERVVFVPNNKLLRYATFNYSLNSLRVLKATVYLDFQSRPDQLRVLIAALEQQIVIPILSKGSSLKRGGGGNKTNTSSSFNTNNKNILVSQEDDDVDEEVDNKKNISSSTTAPESSNKKDIIEPLLSKKEQVSSSLLTESSINAISNDNNNNNDNNNKSIVIRVDSPKRSYSSNKTTTKVDGHEEFAQGDRAYVVIDDSRTLYLGIPVLVNSTSQFYQEQSKLYFDILEILENANIKTRSLY